MNALAKKLSWPLLGKELVEQAARKRTYVVRVIYAAALAGVFLFYFYLMMARGNLLGNLGHGRILFNCILACQCVGILLFLPATMAGVITSEKERGSQELLFLTDLKPWEMILQKYLGRLIPMFSFLLISLPLLAVTYAFGGVDKQSLIDGIAMLFLTCLQFGAFSLMCSAYCGTTTGAVIATYLWGALFYSFLPLIAVISDNAMGWPDEAIVALCPPFEYLIGYDRSTPHYWRMGITIVTLITTGLFLLAARLFFIRRAFLPPGNILLRSFKKMDVFFRARNQLIGGIVFFWKPDSLPDDQPVAWRELERRSLGQWNYLVRIFIVLEAATLLICLLLWDGYSRNLFPLILTVLWVVATLILSAQAVNIISRERINQTLETLLTTQLTGRDILRQKMRGLYRLMWVFAIPMLTIVGVAAWIASLSRGWIFFVTGSILSLIIYLPMIAWISLWISLKCRKRNQALLTGLGVLTVWCVVPPLITGSMALFDVPSSIHNLIFLLSPADVLYITFNHEWAGYRSYHQLNLILTFGFYAVVLYSARVACLRRADRYLRGEATKQMKRLSLIGLILFMLAPGRSALALTVRETRWGYDGLAVPDRFTVLSVLIENRSGEAFDDTISISKNRGMADRVGAVYSQPCYISPFSARWVQFYPYIDQEYDRWILQLGRQSGQTKEIDQPKVGAPACVMFYDPEAVVAMSGSFKMFPDNLFPSSVAATDGLGSLIMDYAPRWEGAKREAFLQWLQQGGTVHLLLGADGKFPVFPEGLDALNAATNQIAVGAGLVVRHQLNRSEIRSQTLIKDGFTQPQMQESGNATLEPVSQSFFQSLIPLSGSHQSWGMIHLFALGYLLVIGPGHFFLAKRLPDYRVRISLLLAGVGCFGALFSYIGRRGQTGTSIVHALSYAHSLHDGTYNVTQWVNVFATHGDYYTITHASPHNLYATTLDYESVKGEIQGGKDGKFMVDIPLYSHRNFLHQASLAGEDIDATVLFFDTIAPDLKAGPHFPKDALEIWALWQNQFYPLKRAGDHLVLDKSQVSQDRNLFLTATELQQMNVFQDPEIAGQEPTAAQYCKAMMKPLIARGLGGTMAYRQSIQWPTPPKDHVQLFVFSRSPESFRVSGDKFGQEIGYVLYHSDLVIPASERNP